MAPFKMPAYASPPISPYDSQSQKENMDNGSEVGVLDPPLFRMDSLTDALAPEVPLFSSQSSSQDIIAQHMQSAEYVRLKSKPTEEDYRLVAQFHSTVFQQYVDRPKQWREQEARFAERYSKGGAYSGASSDNVPKRPAPKKLAPAPAPRSRQPKVALPRAAPRPARVQKKRTPKVRVSNSFDAPVGSASPKTPRPTTRDDLDYNAIEDLSPPLETIRGQKMKVDWKGTKLDLSDDPDRHLLHEAELELAAVLRLSCATYLCSKRRIFVARALALRKGKEFRRTDAQQACKIDVNKASKLWQAYDKLGWFEEHWFPNHAPPKPTQPAQSAQPAQPAPSTGSH